MNGEIYNHLNLRKTLSKDHEPFATNSDCEIILKLYQEHGTELLNMLNGIFSFVLYDEDKDFYLAARDHVGVCPLYMGRAKDGSVWFASEMKALQDHCVTFEDFPPGHMFTSTDGMKRWYQPSWLTCETIPTTPLDLNQLRENFEAAVCRQLMTDVPYG